MQSGVEGENSTTESAAGKNRHPGTVPVLNKRIIALREAKGWSRRTLARKAFCSVASVKSVEEGNEAFPTTLEKIAKPLEVKFTELMKGKETGEATKDPDNKIVPRVKVKVFIHSNYGEFDETKLPELVGRIRQETGATGEITVVIVEEGSVVVILEMDEDDALALMRAFAIGRLG